MPKTSAGSDLQARLRRKIKEAHKQIEVTARSELARSLSASAQGELNTIASDTPRRCAGRWPRHGRGWTRRARSRRRLSGEPGNGG